MRSWSKSPFVIMGVTLVVLLAGTIMVTGELPRGMAGAALEDNERIITGTVIDERGGIAGAVVRLQTSSVAATSGIAGTFSLKVPAGLSGPITLTAWAKGYFIGGPIEANPGQTNVTMTLHRHHGEDNPDYQWLSACSTEGSGENQGCVVCHSGKATGFPASLPMEEWLRDAHSQSAVNPRFLSMYQGTDLNGNRSRPTRYIHTKDYGTFPQVPTPEEAYFGPGYKLDFPDKSGNCAACHAPLAAVHAPYDTDPTQLTGVAREGINCDFCHKVWDVRLDPVTGLPYENRPGVLSFEFRRPPEGHQFFAGPLDDVAPGEDTFSTLQRRSQLCAPCHFGVFWDTVVYNSFGEWLQSPYSRPDGGQTCQDCHMPPLGVDYFALPEKGGLKRDSQSISSHYMPGALDKNLLSNALTLHATARRHDDQLDVRARVVNDLTGHHVPTDSPLRHVILLVTVTQQDGSDATLISGTTLPEWCGVGDPARGCYSGLPGKVFAKVLEEEWTRVAPTGAYWNPTRILEDTRIAAYGQDTSSYHFKVIRSGPVKVDVVLLYRRAYKELMDVKGWDVPDIVMEQKTLTVAAGRGKRNKNLKQRYPLTAATATIHPNEPKMGFSLDL